jgi:hypothetical protein
MSLIAALLLGAPAAQPPSPLPPRPAAVRTLAASDAEQLVDMLLPQDALTRITQRVFDNAVAQNKGTDTERQKLYAATPGLKEAVAERVRAELGVILKRELPGLRTQMVALLTGELSADEISDTLTFFASATGRKMMATMYAGMAETSATNEEQLKQEATASLMRSLTPEDYPALTAFGASSAAPKLQAINPKMQALSKEWATKLIAGNQARLEAVAQQAIADFMARKGK